MITAAPAMSMHVTLLSSMSASYLDVPSLPPLWVSAPVAAQMLMSARSLPCREATTMPSRQVALPQVQGAGEGAAAVVRARARWVLTCSAEHRWMRPVVPSPPSL